ncbi:MAG: hypothetical protein JNJ50_10975 [Acidobacteria bacterium]|nr:hypothetical protein [Acidobacteriota bacterium]
MKSATMKKLFLTSFAVALFLTALAFGQTNSNNSVAGNSAQAQPAAAAQPAAKRQWYYIAENTLKAGVANDYYEFRAKERIPALKKAGYKQQEFWVSVVGESGKIYTVEPMDDLSLFDQSPNRLTKALGEDGARALAAKTMKYIADGGSHTWLARSRPDLSWTEQMTAPPKIAAVSHVKIARGRTADFENYLKNDYLPIVKKSGVLGYSVLTVMYGGDVSEYITLTFFNSFAELEKNDPFLRSTVQRIAGAETAERNFQKTIGVIVGLERELIRFRPDLSILPK